MIIFDKVWFAYGTRQVLKNLSFSIKFNEKVAILGGSGDGKTTIIRLMLRLISPDSGRIIIDGEDITDKTENDLKDTRMKFSVVFQEGALFDSLNVKENVAFYLREYTNMSEEDMDKKVREILNIVGMEHAINMMPEELSGGMHRRVAIARSLAAYEPKMFLYDEPTSGIDPVNADVICRLILELSKNEKPPACAEDRSNGVKTERSGVSCQKGFIVVTHKVTDALKIADRFIFLKHGTIAFDGNKDDLIRTVKPEVKAFLSELNFTPH